MGKLDKQVAIITGGASDIGEATVRLFVKEGARIVIADIQDDKGRRLAEELEPSVVYLHTDVSQEAAVKAAIDYALESFNRMDCIFNNAGIIGVDGSIDSISMKGFDQTIGVLLRGAVLGMKYAASVMKRQKSGRIINNASIAGLRTGYAPHIYSAAKAAIIQLTRSVAMELGEYGIRTNCVCPGFIITPMVWSPHELSKTESTEMIEQLKPTYANYQALHHTGLPVDVAQAVLWLASNDSRFINGHAMVVDGGLISGQTWEDRLRDNSHLQSVMGFKS